LNGKWKKIGYVAVATAVVIVALVTWFLGFIPGLPWFPGKAKVTTDKMAYNQGDTIAWKATGFPANQTGAVTVLNPNGNISLLPAGPNTDASGNATGTFVAGANIVGSNSLQFSTAVPNSSSMATAKSSTFTVT